MSNPHWLDDWFKRPTISWCFRQTCRLCRLLCAVIGWGGHFSFHYVLIAKWPSYDCFWGLPSVFAKHVSMLLSELLFVSQIYNSVNAVAWCNHHIFTYQETDHGHGVFLLGVTASCIMDCKESSACLQLEVAMQATARYVELHKARSVGASHTGPNK